MHKWPLLACLALLMVFVLAGLWMIEKNAGFSIQPVRLKLNDLSAERAQLVVPELAASLRRFEQASLLNTSMRGLIDHFTADERVRNIRVARRWPNRFELSLEMHAPVLNLLNKDMTLLPVARDGSLLPPQSLTQTEDLPVLRGTEFAQSSDLRLRAIDLMNSLPPSGWLNSANVSEVAFDERDGFVLLLIHPNTRIVFGDKDFADRALKIERVLNYLESRQMQSRVIDSRYSKKVVVKLRNAT